MNSSQSSALIQESRLVVSAGRRLTEAFGRYSRFGKTVRQSLALLLALFVCAIVFGDLGCSASEPEMTTGQVLQAAQISKLIGAVCGDDAYAVVDTQWLKWYYGKFRSDLAQGPYGIVHWYDRFDCNRFVAKFAADAQVRFFSHSFHTFTPAKALAVGEFWYQPDRGTRPHAIVFAFTERGLVFIDPQTGKFLSLSNVEIKSHLLAKI